MTSELTPAKVLSKSQLKKAARESKGRTRNVLFNPFRLEWPPVSREAAAAVLGAVDSQFEQFAIPTGVPQAEYAALLAAGDRAGIRARRQEARAAAAPLQAARRAHLADCVLGFNAACRALEAGRLAALLVEADTPALETRFLLPLAAGRRCPAVCLPRLRPALERRLGLQTAVLGLLEGATAAGHHLRPLYDAVCAAASPLIPRRADAAAAAAAGDAADEDAAGEDGEAGEDGDVKAAVTEGARQPPPVTDKTSRPNQSVPTPAAAAAETPPPPTPPTPATPAPFEQSDFISLSVSPPVKRRATDGPLQELISLDTEGVPHKKRLLLKQAPVMQITLGNKALKRAAKKEGELAAKKKGESAAKKGTPAGKNGAKK